MNTQYSLYLDSKKIGTTQLEKADVPMGVVFGMIEFEGIESPYHFFKDYCSAHQIALNAEDAEVELIDTQDISALQVVREDGVEIQGAGGKTLAGMKGEGYELSISGIEASFYEEAFPAYVKAYRERFGH
ncbi:MAG: hypothetical protein AAFR61_11440 [Bacteroidota bacterium]